MSCESSVGRHIYATENYTSAMRVIKSHEDKFYTIDRTNFPQSVGDFNYQFRGTKYQGITIVKEYLFRVRDKNVLNYIIRRGIIHNEAIEEFTEIYNTITDKKPFKFITSMYISSDILSANDWFYVKDYDIVITNTLEHDIKHPYSNESIVETNETKMTKVEGNQIVYDIVDNRNDVSTYYVAIGNNVETLYSRKDPTKNDGLYHYIKRTGILSTSKIMDSDYDTVGVYSNYNDAKTHGNLDLHNKNLLLESNIKNLETSEMKLKTALRDYDHKEKQANRQMVVDSRADKRNIRQQRQTMKHEKDMHVINMVTQKNKQNFDIELYNKKLMEGKLKSTNGGVTLLGTLAKTIL